MPIVSVVLDTNVLVSGLARPVSKPGQILEACSTGSISLILSRYILEETARVMPKFARQGMTSSKIATLINRLLSFSIVVEPSTEIEPALRDQADQQVLGTLRASVADYLITGDKDLLVLADRYSIITPAAFCERHEI